MSLPVGSDGVRRSDSTIITAKESLRGGEIEVFGNANRHSEKQEIKNFAFKDAVLDWECVVRG